jgi:hypothetical protein
MENPSGWTATHSYPAGHPTCIAQAVDVRIGTRPHALLKRSQAADGLRCNQDEPCCFRVAMFDKTAEDAQ